MHGCVVLCQRRWRLQRVIGCLQICHQSPPHVALIALREVYYFPSSLDAAEQARRRLAFDELLKSQLLFWREETWNSAGAEHVL